jgi:hypothetical protein
VKKEDLRVRFIWVNILINGNRSVRKEMRKRME